MLTNWLNLIVKMSKKKDKNTEVQILEAAKTVFQSKGMDGARMQEIADTAGINKAMLHYYFRSKQLLFEAVFKNAFSLLAPQLNAILNDDSSLSVKITNFTVDYNTFMLKHPYLPNFIIQELNRNENFIEKLKETTGFPTLDKFRLKVNEEITKGRIIPIDADQLFVNILALNIFPFIGKPLIKAFANQDEKSYKTFVDQRKTAVVDFIINSIKKH
ncbi:transcriptional regulator, TetR family [Bizionia paragorgiae]|uniref:Transcriptional regulator, TetR family n=2 Tax=Bizionia paragorgiae TaxID=283786 RepID=A0A1H4AE05_BIZPA|nr:transcriptional regulator, TetR family [Bizionia paragorgiae]